VLEDKPYARQMERVTFHRSGKQRGVVQGIALVYDKPAGGPSKNPHFREMLQTAHGRGFRPAYVLLENLKQIAALGWRFLTRLKHNQLVNPDGQGNRPIEAVAIPPEGRAVHLKGFGFVRVFRTVSREGDAEYWATSDKKSPGLYPLVHRRIISFTLSTSWRTFAGHRVP